MPIADHEELIGQFYSAFPYPPRARRLLQPREPGLYPALLAQAIGDFRHETMPRSCSIWVTGCGVNQAVITALMFPDAEVLGTDVSEESLRLSLESSRQLGITNLELRRERLSAANYRESFDYIICTGVLHHHPDPQPLLTSIATALRPGGILELMVYNSYHRTNHASFREAMRLLAQGSGQLFPGQQFPGQRFAAALNFDNSLALDIAEALGAPEEEFRDAWLNPFEQSYTIASLSELASSCGLELEAPRVTPEAGETPLWDLKFNDGEIQDYFEACDDPDRWQVAQLLLMEQSPMIWFYLRRADSARARLSDAQRNTEFLWSVPRRIDSAHRAWILDANDFYRLAEPQEPAQPVWVGAEFQEFYNSIDGSSTVAQICDSLAMATTPALIRRMRALLATPEFPFLMARRQ